MATIETGAHIPNADAIIEKFGGIRPMATKMQVPVTTVQGWKKRNVIPANRVDLLRQSAALHGIDLNHLAQVVMGPLPEAPTPGAAPANDEDAKRTLRLVSSAPEKPAPEVSPIPETLLATSSEPNVGATSPTSVTARPPRSGVYVWLATTLLACAILIGLAVMIPGINRLVVQQDRIAGLEQDLARVNEQLTDLTDQNTLMAGLVPKDIAKQMTELRDQSAALAQVVTNLGTQTKALTTTLVGPDDQALANRVAQMEEQIKQDAAKGAAGAGGAAPLMALIGQMQQWQKTAGGVAMLARAFDELEGLLKNAKPADVPARLNAGIKGTSELKRLFADLPTNDVLLASALLTTAQLQQDISMAQPFADSLRVFTQLMPPRTDSDWSGLFATLTPVVTTGVPTLEQLQDNFAKLGPDLVAQSLRAPGVSWTDRVRARFYNVLRIERAGKPITGTPTQRVIGAAQTALDRGDLGGTLVALQGLDGEIAIKAAPFVAHLDQLMAAQKLRAEAAKMMAAQLVVAPAIQNWTKAYAAGPDAAALGASLVKSLAQ